jgi:hypothetical protein
MKRLVIIILLAAPAVFWACEVTAQCCAAGNPITADGSAGGGGKNILEVQALYKFSYSDTYFEGSTKTDYKYIDYSSFDFTSLRLAYGITDRLKASFELGYFFSKAQTFSFGFEREANGIGDGVVGLQYNAYKNQGMQLDLFPYVRFTVPIGVFDQMNGPVVLPIDIQPSSGSYKYLIGALLSKRFAEGKVAMFLDGSVEISQRINTERTNYKYGNLYNVSLYGSYQVIDNLILAVQLRNQVRDKASNKNNELINATGGHVMFLTPQLRYTFFTFWNASMLYEYPFYKDMNGKQLTNNFALTLRLGRTINFSKH